MDCMSWPPPAEGYVLRPPTRRWRDSVHGQGNVLQNFRDNRSLHNGTSNGNGDAPPTWTTFMPVLSIVLGIVQLILYVLCDIFGIQSEEYFGVSWDTTVTLGAYWRLVIAHFFHAGRLHVLLNVISMFCFGRFLERKIQWFPLLLIIHFIGVGSNVLFMASNRFITQAPDALTCGFSHIHFGLRVLLAYTQEPRNYQPSLFLGLYPAYLSPVWAPWQPLLEVTLLKLIITELNVSGHFSGIVIGFLVSFLLKLFPPRLIYTQQYVNARNWRQD